MWWHPAVLLACHCSSCFAFTLQLGAKGQLKVCTETIMRIVRWPTDDQPEKISLIARGDWPPVDVQHRRHGDIATVETSSVIAQYSFSQDVVTFRDKRTGKLVLQELSHEFEKSEDLGQRSFQVEQSWTSSSANEGFFGGGGYQNGIVNFKNAPIQMIQHNTEAVVPFFTSTQGYGILWDNYAWTFLNPPKLELVRQGARKWGSTLFTPSADGDHFFYVGRGFPQKGESPAWTHGIPQSVQVNITGPEGDVVVVQSWLAANTPASLTGRVSDLKRGLVYTVSYKWDIDGVGLYAQGPEYGKTTLRSFLGNSIDYYVTIGTTADDIIRGYRLITGSAPLYSKWVYGFWQCKEHYKTQQELLAGAKGFRDHSIPMDAIVQDWLYWGKLGWGPQWDPQVYPDPRAMTQELKTMNVHLMVSVWSKFAHETVFFESMFKHRWLLNQPDVQEKHGWFDAWNPGARELFYNFSNDAHFSIGVDALWLDATEPEGYINIDASTALGSGNAYMNTYSLKATEAISVGLRRDYPSAQGSRVFSLTRSSFAGQQRTGAVLWSGDISASWDMLRRQVASSINYQLSGIPYWAQDIGGFFRPSDQYESSAYHELLIRWFQFGVFTPIFRQHGAGSQTELWNYGDDTMRIINSSAIALRYRLLPYIYSGFARVEMEGYTMQRGLIMDFWQDASVRNIADQFMWGDAFLVTPFVEGAKHGEMNPGRKASFPAADSWFNFQTGAAQPPGLHTVRFPLHQAPAFVRAGSIVPMGPQLQYASQKPADPLEIRVYPGADGKFTLFEDDGVSRSYQGGNRTTIDFHWSEATRTLSVGDRAGQFAGQLQARTFNVVCVAPGHGIGVEESPPDAIVQYWGQASHVQCPSMVSAYI